MTDFVFRLLLLFLSSLLREMMLAWDCFLAIAFVLWVLLRVAYVRSLVHWKRGVQVAKEEQAADVWALSRMNKWEARQRLMDAYREGYAEVVRPLAPYVLVFGVFAIPAVIMSTEWCQVWWSRCVWIRR